MTNEFVALTLARFFMKKNNKKYKLYALLPLLLLLSSFVLSAQIVQNGKEHLISVEELLTNAVGNSKTLQVAAARIAIADAKSDQINAALLPTIAYTGGYTRLSTNVEPFAITFPNGQQEVLNPILPNQFVNRISISEPLFTGFRGLNSIELYHILACATRLDAKRDSGELKINVLTAALNLYKLQEAQQIFNANLRTAENRLIDLDNLRKQGIVLNNDVMKAELAKAQIETARIETENNILATQYALCLLAGLPENTPLRIDSSSIFRYLPTQNQDLNALLSGAAQKRPDINALDTRLMASEKQIKISQGSKYPFVTATANLYFNNPNQRVFPPEARFYGTWDIGIALNWNLTNLYTARFHIAEARANHLQNRLQREQLSDAARSEITNNYYTWQTQQQKVKFAEKAIAQATENRRIVEARQAQQIASSTELLDADALLLQTQINRITAQTDERLQYYKLLKSAGKW